MSTFVAIAQSGSLSGASRQLATPLTTISRQLASLEAHLGTSLVARTTRHLALTEAGRAYLDVCTRLLQDLDGVESQISRDAATISGNMEVTAPIVFGRLHVLPIVGRFLNANPRVNCRLTLNDRNVDLTRDAIDVAIRIGQLASSSLIAAKVGSLHLVTCAAPDYLKRRGTPEQPSDLAEHDCIAYSTFAGGGTWTYKSKQHGQHIVRFRRRFSTNTAEAAIDAATAGLGLARVLSYQAEAALSEGRLVTVLDDYEDTLIPVHCVHRPARIPQPQIIAFAKFTTAALRKTLSRDRF